MQYSNESILDSTATNPYYNHSVYNFDVFLSCADDDRKSARLLAQKLRELNFHVWLDFENGANESSNSAKALEDSAVCVLLVGAAGNLSWMSDSHRFVIRKRLESTDRVLRTITVFLPNNHSHSNLVRSHRLILVASDERQNQCCVRFRKTLDEKDSLHELILRIRGIKPKQDNLYQSAVQSRAENALNVDWYNLALAVYVGAPRSAKQDSLQMSLLRRACPSNQITPSRDRGFWPLRNFRDHRKPLIPLKLIQPSESHHTPWLPARFESIRNITTIAALLLVIMGTLARPDMQYVYVEKKPDVVAQLSSYNATNASPQSTNKSEKKKRSSVTTNIASARNQSQSSSTEWRDRVGDFVESVDHASYSRTSEARGLPNSDAVLPSGDESKSGFTTVYKRKFKGRQQERFASVINPKINEEPRAFIVSSDIGSEPANKIKRPGTERINNASRDVLLSSNEVSREAKDPERWDAFDRSKLAAMREIYVEISNDADLDAELRSRVITEFIKPLQENGVEVVLKKKDRNATYGIARLRFGEREMKSGVVSVDIEDSKGQLIKSFFAPATCTALNQKALAKILCEASQVLGDKLSDALQDAEQQ